MDKKKRTLIYNGENGMNLPYLSTKIALAAALSFFAGRITSLMLCVMTFSPNSTTTTPTALSISISLPPIHSLHHQIQDQKTFQNLIYKSQTTCGKRYLIRDAIPPKDGFCSEFQYVSRLLQVSVSTRRILVMADSWKSAYCPTAEQGGWTCLWQSFTNCTPGTKPAESNWTLLDTAFYPMNYGILPQRQRSPNTSPWFDPLLYGSRPKLPAPISFPLKNSAIIADVIPHWERSYGRYWIRSMMAHFLWRPSGWLSKEIQHRLVVPTRTFIGIHVRYTDNIPDFQKSFGRNATYTRQLERFLDIATNIQKSQKDATNIIIRDIYLATDHELVLSWAQEIFKGWTIWAQEEYVPRSTTQNRVWFADGRSSAAGAMAADLEVLRRADYLIGSFQSNVYRLAAQLNTAWNVEKYSVRLQRHYTVDVEWFEDP